MAFKKRQFGFEVKDLTASGSFAGYGSVFQTVDYYRDVVMPGAFEKTLAAWAQKDLLPPILWQHRPDSPIGPFQKMVEDGRGLYVEGQLLINDVQQSREAYALLKSKTINGMSIGYDPVEVEYDGKTNVNKLLQIDLWEVSICTFPANTDAIIDEVKGLLRKGDLPTLAAFEDFLRDAGGFSRNQAKAIAGHGLAKLLAEREAATGLVDQKCFDEILAMIRQPRQPVTL